MLWISKHYKIIHQRIKLIFGKERVLNSINAVIARRFEGSNI